jgi:Flp pilus assembly pilin Flp
MKRRSPAWLRCLRDDRGGEVLEWVIIAGLLLVTVLAAVASVGTKVLARWNTANGGN